MSGTLLAGTLCLFVLLTTHVVQWHLTHVLVVVSGTCVSYHGMLLGSVLQHLLSGVGLCVCDCTLSYTLALGMWVLACVKDPKRQFECCACSCCRPSFLLAFRTTCMVPCSLLVIRHPISYVVTSTYYCQGCC